MNESADTAMTANKVCYFTGTNREADLPMIATMIRSARAVDVESDFVVFGPIPCGEDVEHIRFNGDWRSHMAKLDLLRTFASREYETAIWLDADTWFCRNPGDVTRMMGDDPCWTMSEGEITGGQLRKDISEWWALGLHDGFLARTMQSYGCPDRVWSTNGGMFMVRRESIQQFCDIADRVWRDLRPRHPLLSDEPSLAIACQTMITDASKNTVEHCGSVWAADWAGRWKRSPPDGDPWEYTEWLTGVKTMINPAIIHTMRLKEWMRKGGRDAEPVGAALMAILKECGINRPSCVRCTEFIEHMNGWGISGCKQRRTEILHRLAEESDTGSWLEWANVAAHGHFSCGSLLDEAIRRASL